MTKLDFLKDWYQRIWIEADLDAIDRYFVPRAGAEGILPDGQVGAEDFRALVPALRALVRNLTIEVDQFREGEDWLWAHVSVCALPAHGISPVRANGQVMLHFADGLIAEAYNTFDFLSFFEGVKLLPQDSFLLLLSGDKLG